MVLPIIAATLMATTACRDSIDPVSPRPAFTLTEEPVNADSIQLAHLCSTRFRVRSYNDAAAELKWQVGVTADSGRVTVPGRTDSQTYGEVYFTTATHGTVTLKFDTLQVDTASSANTACPPGVVVPATPPDSFPAALIDSLGTTEIGSTGRHFVRNIVMVGFEPGIPQAKRQAAIDQVRGTVVGGKRQSTDEGYYIVQLPGDGSYEAIGDALAALLALPQVEIALEMSPTPPGESSYLTPSDGAADHGDHSARDCVVSEKNVLLERISPPKESSDEQSVDDGDRLGAGTIGVRERASRCLPKLPSEGLRPEIDCIAYHP